MRAPLLKGVLLGSLLVVVAWALVRPAASGQDVVKALPGPSGERQQLWYHTGYGGGVGNPVGASALKGPAKMPAIFERIQRDAVVVPQNLFWDEPSRPRAAAPVDLESLRAVHADGYLLAVLTGEPAALATSQGLPYWSEAIARGWLLNVGGLAAAAEAALRHGLITGNLAHGYHHAVPDRGMGFCTLNGLAVVAQRLVREGRARRILIVDLDQHEGNGTGACVLGERGIWNLTLFGSPAGGPPASANNRPYQVNHHAFPVGPRRDLNYLATIAALLPKMIEEVDPDLVLYQAGMDPYDAAAISGEALAVRDAYVMALARSKGKPVCWVLAGGYADLETVVRLHVNTVRVANTVLQDVQPGMSLVMTADQPYRWEVAGGQIRFPAWARLLGQEPAFTGRRMMNADQAEAFANARRNLLARDRHRDGALEQAYSRLLKGLEAPR